MWVYVLYISLYSTYILPLEEREREGGWVFVGMRWGGGEGRGGRGCSLAMMPPIWGSLFPPPIFSLLFRFIFSFFKTFFE